MATRSRQANISELTLFGFTRTDPRNYYFRTATFDDEVNATIAVWNAWQALGITINSDHVYPVRAFGRTFVFWAETEQVKPDNQSTATLQTTTSGNTQTVSGQSQVQYRVKMMYSFLNLSGQWTAPQTLDVGALESLDIGTTHLRVTCAEPDGPKHGRINRRRLYIRLGLPPSAMFASCFRSRRFSCSPNFCRMRSNFCFNSSNRLSRFL